MSSTPPPKVSVVMSAYNREPFLRDAILSVLAQTEQDFEFIIFDNFSSDSSARTIEEFTDPRIRFSRNTRNLGPVTSLNNGLERARGRYVTFAHGDDIWMPDFLEEGIRLLEAHPGAALCHSLMHIIDQDGTVTLNEPGKDCPEFTRTSGPDLVRDLVRGCYVRTPTIIMRRDRARFFDMRYIYTIDWDLYLNMAACGEQFVCLNKPVMYYRVSTASETAVGYRSGDLVLESYLVLRNFFKRYPEFRSLRVPAFKKLAMSILRRSRDAADRETFTAFLGITLLCRPAMLVNPVFLFYVVWGGAFGPSGMQMFKQFSRSVTKTIRRRL
jgi:glycosyltransferase involved in cell wall biosynthesis